MSINSTKAFYLAETAAMFALQDAKYRFYGGSFNFGAFDDPNEVATSTTEVADYWLEDDDLNPGLYTIIATGKVLRGNAAVAIRQIKIKADITPNIASPVQPGIHTEGTIKGNGQGFDMWMDGLDVDTDDPSVKFDGTFANSDVDIPPGDGSRDGIVYQSSAYPAPDLDENLFKALATDQIGPPVHYYGGNFAPGNGYPNGSYNYSGSIPNITYVGGNLNVNGNIIVHGVYWVKGEVNLNGNCRVNGIIITEGNIDINGGGNTDPNVYGGIIQYDSSNTNTLTGNGNANLQVNNGFFDDLNSTIPIITVQSWQEAVSAN
jgi:hypothetical protein